MSDFDCDILMSGGGVAGLAAAAAFGAAGFSVICVDPAPPVTDRDAEGADLRSTALLQPARALLEETALWDVIAPYATPLEVMRIVDAGGAEAEPRRTKDFRAAELGDLPFGWNVPNWALRRALVERIETLEGVDFRPGIATAGLVTRSAAALVRLSDGSRVRAKLAIAADGRASPLRQAAGIGVRTRRYGQKALAFAVTHPIPHENVSTEVHRTGGPFTLVPLPDRDGLPSSAVVWMDDGAEQVRRMALPDNAFEAEMSERSCHLHGPLTLASRRSIWPIISQQATALTGQRVALMAEAAHVVPPIGAQGLNMSLADLGSLLSLARKAPERLGDDAMLDAYARARRADIAVRVAGIDTLNRVSQASGALMRDARGLGMDLLHDTAPIRRGLMKLGLGV
ncbi:MAG: UbiH/UbiF family hydroxylase [Pseudomonadota bacterium]